MNFSQRLGLLILIAISVLYVYSTYFNKEFKMPEFNNQQKEQGEYNPFTKPEESEKTEKKSEQKNVKIFVLDKTGNLRSVNRTCDTAVEKSCFVYAIKELVKAPSKWEKSKGFTSEIPQGTKILSPLHIGLTIHFVSQILPNVELQLICPCF